MQGLVLTEDEREFFRDVQPLGFILFERNCDNPAQLKKLTGELKETLGLNCPILIDQEGGRVQRLKPPHWRRYPPMKTFGDLAAAGHRDEALERLGLDMPALAEELAAAGLNVNCTPVLDLPMPGAHDVIGDRAFSDDPEIVAGLGLSVCRFMLESGITPVIKHLPGHGRALSDSHKDLPTVDIAREELEQTDFKPFKALADSDIGANLWGMTAHILYPRLDSERPCSLSPLLIDEIIRGFIGFDGPLLSDDLFMEALAAYGDVPARGRLCIEAGCDAVLHCHGDVRAMERAAKEVGQLGAKARKRLQNASQSVTLAA